MNKWSLIIYTTQYICSFFLFLFSASIILVLTVSFVQIIIHLYKDLAQYVQTCLGIISIAVLVIDLRTRSQNYLQQGQCPDKFSWEKPILESFPPPKTTKASSRDQTHARMVSLLDTNTSTLTYRHEGSSHYWW